MRIVKINDSVRVYDIADNDLEIETRGGDSVIFYSASAQAVVSHIDTKFAPDVVRFLGERLTWGDIKRLVIRYEDDSLHVWADDTGMVFE